MESGSGPAHDLTVTAIGHDRPGMVAAVTKVFFEVGCNLADCSMTRLSGQFAIILVAQAPGALSAEQLEQALKEAGTEFNLAITVREAPAPSAKSASRTCVISLYGADHPGIVYRVTSRLAAHSANITDLVSRIAGESLYTMVLDVELAENANIQALEQDLQLIAKQMGVEINLRPTEVAEL